MLDIHEVIALSKKGNGKPKNDTQKKVAKTTETEGKVTSQKQGEKGSNAQNSPEKNRMLPQQQMFLQVVTWLRNGMGVKL